jgi:hypothetical protein
MLTDKPRPLCANTARRTVSYQPITECVRDRHGHRRSALAAGVITRQLTEAIW